MTKFSAFLSASALALSGVTALAADLPVRAPAPAPLLALAPFSWNGFYVGLHAGYGWTISDEVGIHTTPPIPNGVFRGNIGNVDPKGILGGAQIGYNLQYGNIVYGVEGDISFTDRRASTTGLILGVPVTVRAREQWFGSVRGRLGLAADRALFYVTGGVGFTDIRSSATVPGFGNFSNTKTQVGWVAGGGVEYAFTNNWTARLEGLYYHVKRYRFTAVALAGTGYTNVTQSHALARIGVNYKF